MNKIIKTVKVGQHVLEVMKTAILSRGSIEPIRVFRMKQVDGSYVYGDCYAYPDYPCQINAWALDYATIRDWWNNAVERAYSVVEFGDDALLPEQWIEG